MELDREQTKEIVIASALQGLIVVPALMIFGGLRGWPLLMTGATVGASVVGMQTVQARYGSPMGAMRAVDQSFAAASMPTSAASPGPVIDVSSIPNNRC